jgi:NAD(P)H-hydrate epimerase
MKILDSKQMRNIDARATREYGISSLILMENAGLASADALEEILGDAEHKRIALLCGRGSNGGDGFVLARHLFNRGLQPRVILLCAAAEVQGDAQINLRILQRMGVDLQEATDGRRWAEMRPELDRFDVLVDAILGTGLQGPVRGFLREAISSLAGYPGLTVSLDLPSGLSADSSEVPGEAVVADHTLTMGLPKIPHFFPPAELFCGEVAVLDISLPEAAIDAEGVGLELVEEDVVRRALPPRPRQAHKGDFGRLLVVGGSRSRPGAAALAALGALRAGAGLVTVATGRSALPLVHAHCPEVMLEPLAETERGTLSRRAAAPLIRQGAEMDAVILGPGLGQATDVAQVIRALVDQVRAPVVVDADGLNAIAGHLEVLPGSAPQPRILTPHPGEMARLLGKSIREVQRDRIGAAGRFARKHRCWLVLKGYRTLTAAPSGEVHVNPTGNPGMATAGTGDVLAGMIGALVAQAGEPLPGILAAVYLHGLAGDLAAAHRGEAGMIASDLLAHVPEAIRRVRGEAAAEP